MTINKRQMYILLSLGLFIFTSMYLVGASAVVSLATAYTTIGLINIVLLLEDAPLAFVFITVQATTLEACLYFALGVIGWFFTMIATSAIIATILSKVVVRSGRLI